MYANPYLQVEVNHRYSTTILIRCPNFSRYIYNFEYVEIPESISVESISVQVKSYFFSAGNILQTENSTLDLNEETTDVDRQILFWEADFINGQQEGNFTCTQQQQQVQSLARKSPCALNGMNPGLWDTSSNSFIPSSCFYTKSDSRDPASTLAHEWIHFFGDSNFRNLHKESCSAMGSTQHNIFGDNEQWSVCFSPDGSRAHFYSVSFMLKDKVFLIGNPFLGENLAAAICDDARIPKPVGDDCKVVWNVPAKKTFILVGSHYPGLLIPNASKEVGDWMRMVVSRIPRVSSVVLVLTGSVCIRHYNRFPQYWKILFQNNNYRLSAMNNVSVAHAGALGLDVVDLFSVTLAAGCGPLSHDIVHFAPPVYAAQWKIVSAIYG